MLKSYLEKLKYNHLAAGASYNALIQNFMASNIFQSDILNIYF